MIPSNNPREPVVFGFRLDGSLVNILKEKGNWLVHIILLLTLV